MPKPSLPKLARTKGPQNRAADHVAADVMPGRHIYVTNVGWFVWDGRRWAEDEDGAAVRDAIKRYIDGRYEEHSAAREAAKVKAETIAAVVLARQDGRTPEKALELVGRMKADQLDKMMADQPELAQYNGHRDDEAFHRERADIWLNNHDRGGVMALAAICADRADVRHAVGDLDAHPDLLNTRTGVVDLRTGLVLELSDTERAALLITKLADQVFDPDAQCPVWDRALGAMAEGLESWLALRFGQSATGHRPDDDVLLVNAGGGENGKTTVISAVMRALGDYAGLVPTKALIGGDARSHSTELTTFRGLRMAVLEETPEAGRLDVHRVKATVGTPFITARRMRQDDITFPTTHSMWINTNHLPQVAETDDGTWRRLVAVPWPYRFVKGAPAGENERQGDRTLRPALIDNPTDATMSAVLAWVVRGAAAWYAAGRLMPYPHPAPVEAKTTEWRNAADVMLRFVQEYLVADASSYITLPDMASMTGEFLASETPARWSASKVRERLESSFAYLGWPVACKQARRGNRTRSHRPDHFGTQQEQENGKGWFGVRFRVALDDQHLTVVPLHNTP